MEKFAPVMLTVLLAIAAQPVNAKVIESQHLVGFGSAKYPNSFTHFDYVNPNAPKYGKVTFGKIGTFDNFNRFASRGVAAADTSQLYDSLFKVQTTRSILTIL